jgi:hypothetical protein
VSEGFRSRQIALGLLELFAENKVERCFIAVVDY